MRALACDGSEVTPTSEGRTGGNEPSQRHERATSPMLRRRGGVKCGMAYGTRVLGSRSFQNSQRTGKPSTRTQRRERSPRAKGSRCLAGKDVKVREDAESRHVPSPASKTE